VGHGTQTYPAAYCSTGDERNVVNYPTAKEQWTQNLL